MVPMMVLALLSRHMGRKRAIEMAFLGERLSANTAKEFGIVNRVCPRPQFDAEAGKLVVQLAEKSSSILRLGKEALQHLETRRLEEELVYLESALARVMACSDSKEGMRAFLEKRKPQWKDE